MRKTITVLAGIFLLGLFLRFYQLGNVPVGLHRDEAFLGYNAFSLLKTGRDMTGTLFPVHLESFLYSPAGYSYISIPFIAIFGLHAFSVRFASALFGSLTILATFFLAQELFKKDTHISLIASLFLAISPWHINLSRTATENTLVVFFIALGVLFFLYWVKNRLLIFLITAFASFGITIGMYQAPRVFLPFFIPLLCFVHWKEVRVNKLTILVTILFFVIILLPLLFILKSPMLSLRIRTVSILASSNTQLTLDEQIREDGSNARLARVFHNKLISYGSVILSNYFDHFSYRFLFTDNVLPMRYRIPGSSLVYLFELPLLLFGAWSLLHKQPKAGMFFLGWVALAPVGSALTFDDVPNLQRTLLLFPALPIISSYGFVSLFTYVRKYRIAMLASGIIVLWSVMMYIHQYYVHGIVHQPWFRQEGYNELVAKVGAIMPSYTKAIITNRETAPTIFFLFYENFSPGEFQKIAAKSPLRDFDRVGFGPYEFSQEQCPFRDIVLPNGTITTTGEKGIVYVNSGLCNGMKYGRLLGKVHRSDNSLVFKIYDLQ